MNGQSDDRYVHVCVSVYLSVAVAVERMLRCSADVNTGSELLEDFVLMAIIMRIKYTIEECDMLTGPNVSSSSFSVNFKLTLSAVHRSFSIVVQDTDTYKQPHFDFMFHISFSSNFRYAESSKSSCA